MDSADVLAEDDGYLLRIEAEQLKDQAREHDLIVRVEHRPGQFVQRDDVVLQVWPCSRLSDFTLKVLRQSFTIGDQRSLAQDAEFALEQLVEVATRALSPGINDPFTAMQCVDRLGAALSLMANRHIPSPYRMDKAGQLRVLAYPKTFGDFLDVSYNQIRQYAANSLDVLLRMLDAVERIARHTQRLEDRQSLQEHAKMVFDLAMEAATAARDKKKVERRYTNFQCTVNCTVHAASPETRGDRQPRRPR